MFVAVASQTTVQEYVSVGGVKASSHVKTGCGDDREEVCQDQDENLEHGEILQ